MSNSIYMQFREQFIAKHGDYVQTGFNWCLFEDGAGMGLDARGPYEEPPADPLACAKSQVRYHEERLRRAAEKFEAMKNELHSSALAARRQGSHGLDKADLKPLKELQKLVKQRQRELEAAHETRDQLTPAHVRDREADMARKVQATEDFIAELKSIKV
jgi:hypothetical protein